MVGIVSSNGLGLFNSSLDILGLSAGQSGLGQPNGQDYVNIATGNLSIQFLDKTLSGTGADLLALRTYNSQGALNDGDADGWRWNGENRLTLTGTVNTSGSTLKRTASDGSETIYSWNGSAYVSTAGSGAHDSITWNGSNEYAWKEDGSDGIIERYDYTTGLIKNRRDNSGNGFDYTFSSGKLVTVKDVVSGQTLEFTYGGNGKLARIDSRLVSAGALTQQVYYTYDASNRLSSVTTDLSPSDNSIADGKTYVTTYTYDGTSNRIASISQSDGTLVNFTYDASLRIATVVDQSGTTTFAYSAGSTTVTNGNGEAWVYTYDANKQLTKYESPAVNAVKQSMSYAYDASGNVTGVTDGRNNTVTYTYDANGNRTKEVDSLGNTVTRTYSATNRTLTETRYTVPSLTTPSGAETARYVYDASGRLRFTVSAEGRVTETRYSAQGQVAQAIQYAGGVYNVTLLAITDSLTETQLNTWVGTQDKTKTQLSEFTYDYRGNLSKKTSYATVNSTGVGVLDNAADVTEYVYSEYGQLLQTIAVRGATRTTKTTLSSVVYDGFGRQTSLVNETGTTTTTYSGVQTTISNSASGLSVVSTTDNRGRLTSLTSSGDATNRTTSYTYDNSGRLRITQDPTGVRSYIFYDAAGRVASKVDAVGDITAYTYDADGRTLTETRYATPVAAATLATWTTLANTPATVTPTVNAANDRLTTYTYDAAGRMLTATVNGVATVTNTYDGESRLIQTQQGDRITRYFYDRDGLKVGMLDAERYLTQYVYDAAGRITLSIRYGAIQASAAQQASATFDSIRTTVNNGARLTTYYFYDSEGRQTGVVNEQGFLTVTVYDAVVNRRESYTYSTPVSVSESNTFEILETLAAVKARAGTSYWTNTNYDAYGRVDTIAQQNGRVDRNVYDAAGRLARQILSEGDTEGNYRVTQTRFNAFSEVTGNVSGLPASGLTVGSAQSTIDTSISTYGTRYDIDGAGRRIAEYGPNGQKTLMYYDKQGRVAYTVKVLATTDSQGNVIYSASALGEASRFAYNAFGEVTEMQVLTNRIDTTGLTGGLDLSVVSTRVAAAQVTSLDTWKSYTYDRVGHVTNELDGERYETVRTFNTFGEQVTERNYITSSPVTSKLAQFTRDKLGRVTATAEDVEGANITTSQTVYDGFGRVKNTLDGNGRTSTINYTNNGRTVTTIDPLGYSRQIDTDALGRTLNVYDGFGNLTSYSYDDVNRKTTVTLPEGGSVTTWRTRTGETAQTQDANGVVTVYTYTKDGSLDTVTTAGVLVTNNDYDNSGRLSQTTNANGTVTTFSYDAANRLIFQSVDPTGLNIRTNYQYDGQGRKILVTDAYGTSDASATQYTYDRKGQIKQVVVDPNGLQLSTTFTYDGLGQTTKVEKGTVASPSQQVTIYDYDKLGRKISERLDPTGLNITTQYRYDNNGNLTRVIDANGNSTWYVYNSAGKKALEVNALGAVSWFDYDNNGNLVQTRQYYNTVSTVGYGDNIYGVYSIPAASVNDRRSFIVYDENGRSKYTLSAIDSNNWAIAESIYDNNGNIVESRVYDQTLSDTRVQVISATNSVSGAVIRKSELSAELTTLGYSASNAGNARVTRYAYDAFNRVRFTVDAMGYVSENTYDAMGNVKTLVQFNVAPSLATYSESAINTALTSLRTDLFNRTTGYDYDKAGRQIRTTLAGYYSASAGKVTGNAAYADSFQRTVEVTYNALGNAVANKIRTGVSSYVSQYKTYDAAGREINDIDALGYVTQKTYDAMTNLKTVTRSAAPIGAVPARGYWLNSEIGVQSGRTITNNYDAAGRKTSVVQPAVSGGTPTTSFAYDALGNLIKQSVLISGVTTSDTYYYYDAIGRQTWTIDALKYGTKTDFDALGNTTQVTEYAIATTLGVSTATNPASVFTGNVKDRINSYTYNALGKVKTTSSSVNGTMTLMNTTDYNAFGEVSTSTDALGATTSIFYNKLGQTTKIVEPARAVATSAIAAADFTLAGNQQTVAPTTDMAYDAFGQRKQEIHSATAGRGTAITVNHTYDAAGNEIATTDGNGNVINMAYDSNGRVIRQYQSISVASTAVGYDNSYSHTIDRRFEYDAAGRQTANLEVVNGQIAGQVDTYNGYGEIQVERKVWGAVGTVTANLNSAISAYYDYDAAGRVNFKHSTDGYVAFVYDLAGRATQATQKTASSFSYGGTYSADDRITQTDYDLLGRVTTQRMPKFSSTTALSETLTLQTPTVSQTLDRWGNVLTRTDAAGKVSTFQYNQSNQVISEMGPSVTSMAADGVTLYVNNSTIEHSIGYDLMGRVKTDSFIARYGSTLLGTHTTTNTYNSAGQLTKTEGPIYGDTTEYAYDIHGNKVATKTGVGIVTLDSFDTNNQVTTHALLRGGAAVTLSTYKYDQAGRQYQETDAAGNSQYYKYDAKGNKIESRNQVGNLRSATYDAFGNKTQDGYLVSFSSSSPGTTIIGYTSYGQPIYNTVTTTGTTVVPTNDWTYKYADYEFGRQASHAAGGVTYDYSYTGFGQMYREQNRSNAANWVEYRYTENGLLQFIGETQNTGTSFTTTSTYSYDIRGNRTVEINSNNVYYAAYTYTPYGSSTSVTVAAHTESSVQKSLFQFDALNRLEIVKSPAGNFGVAGSSYATSNLDNLTTVYDQWGNRRKVSATYNLPLGTSKTISEYYDYDAANRVTVEAGFVSGGKIVAGQINNQAVGTAFSYDHAGRRVTEDRWSSYTTTPAPTPSNPYGVTRSTEVYTQHIYTYNDLNLIATDKKQTVTRAANADASGAPISYTGISYIYSSYDDRGFKLTSNSTSTNRTTTFTYNADGTSSGQKVSINGTGTPSYVNSYGVTVAGTPDTVESTLNGYSYDTLGNMLTYTSSQGGVTNNYSYSYIDTYSGRQIRTIGIKSTQAGTAPGVTTNTYDTRGRMSSAAITEANPAGNTIGTGYRYFAYNASGQIIGKVQQAYGDSTKTQSYFYQAGNQLAELGDLKIDISPLSAVYSGGNTPGSYTIMNGDTLMNIAQAVLGDGNLWYVIADANGLVQGPTQAFTNNDAGRTLRIPNGDLTVRNTSSNYKPYNASEKIGDLTPSATQLPPPPPPKHKGCNAFAMILMVVVAVVLTVVTAGAAAVALGAVSSSVATAGVWAAGTAVLGGAAGFGIGVAAAAFAGGVVGSLGSQIVGKALGVVDHISLRQAVSSGFTSVFAAGAGAYLQGATWATKGAESAGKLNTIGNVARGAAGYLGSYASNKISGLETKFNWTDMAVAAVSSGITGKIGSPVPDSIGGIGDGFVGNVASNFFGSTVSSSLSRLVGRGEKQNWGAMLADAFGNALATEIVSTMTVHEHAANILEKAGLSSDRTDHRFSSDFARSLVKANLSDEDMLIVLGQESIRAGLLDQDAARAGGISDKLAGDRASNFIERQQREVAERKAPVTSDAASGSPTSDSVVQLETVVVYGRRDPAQGPNGETITKKLFTGGIQLVDGFLTLQNDHPILANVAFEAAKGVMTGGPIKTVLTKLAKTVFDGVVGEARAVVSNMAQTAATDFVTGLGLNAEMSIAGHSVELTSEMFGQAAGQLAGGVVDTIFDGGIKQIADRGSNVRNMVKAGDHGSYGDLASRSKKDGLQVDHIPSHASNVKDAEATLGRKLTPKEEAELKARGGAVVVSDEQHMQESRTYGGRNNQQQQAHDAANPETAINLDLNKHREYLKSQGKTDQQINQILNDLVKIRKDLIPKK